MRRIERKRSSSRGREGASPQSSDTDSSSGSSSSDDEAEVDPAVEAERLRYVPFTCCRHARSLISLLTPRDAERAEPSKGSCGISGALHGVYIRSVNIIFLYNPCMAEQTVMLYLERKRFRNKLTCLSV